MKPGFWLWTQLAVLWAGLAAGWPLPLWRYVLLAGALLAMAWTEQLYRRALRARQEETRSA